MEGEGGGGKSGDEGSGAERSRAAPRDALDDRRLKGRRVEMQFRGSKLRL